MKKESGEKTLSVWTAPKFSVFWHSVFKSLKKWHNAMVSDDFLRGHSKRTSFCVEKCKMLPVDLGGGGATNNTHTQVLLKCCHVLENAKEARCEHNG